MRHIRPNGERIASKVMEGEAILINLTTGIYYSLDDVASELWEAISEGSSEPALSTWIASNYNVDIDQSKKDITAFFDELLAEEIVVETAEGAATPAAGSANYAAPKFERFDDMAEMFALDPPLPGLANKE